MLGKAVVTCLLLAWFGAASAAPLFIFSPYKYLPQSPMAPGKAALSWAFATGECGQERWGKQDGASVAREFVPRFVAAKTGYIVSTGGEGGVFTCASDAGMQAFIERYRSPQLLGFDFDIEASQTPEQIDSLIARIKAATVREPGLRVSFTVATFAATDGSKASLNALGETILAAIRKHQLDSAIFNLMVMNFGPPESKNCVVLDARCDMGASALQAARNLHEKHQIPYSQIELTAMIGVNDVAENVFRLVDMRTMKQGARKLGLAGLHFWSVDRDKPCDAKTAQADCSGLKAPAGAFTKLGLTP